MKKFSNLFVMALLTVCMGLTSCEDILGHWEKPTPVTPTPTPEPTMLETPLTLEAVSGTLTVTIKTDFATGKTIEYSTDDGATWTAGAPSLGGGSNIDACANPVTIEGSKIMLRGTNPAYAEESVMEVWFTKIVCDANCYIYGNVMSLIDKDNFATLTAFDTTNGTYAFYGLFEGNTYINNHAEKKLLLPATTLAERCYSNMFEGCTLLTTAPELPATTLARSCYWHMFENCSSLSEAWVKAAFTITYNECENMFENAATSGSTLHTTAATGWNSADAVHKGNLTADNGWTD